MSLISSLFSSLKSCDVFTDFSLLIQFDSFKFSRCCFITDGAESRKVLIDSSLNFQPSVSTRKLPIIGFYLLIFEMSLNTISNGFCLCISFLYRRSSRFPTQASFNPQSVSSLNLHGKSTLFIYRLTLFLPANAVRAHENLKGIFANCRYS